MPIQAEDVDYVRDKKAGGGWDYAGWVIQLKDGSTTRLEAIKAPHGGQYDFDRVVELTGVEHWKRTKGKWVPDPAGKSAARPCCTPISTNERWSHRGPCPQPIKEDGLCGTHLRQKKKHAADDEAYKKGREASNAGAAIAKDAQRVLEQRGVSSRVHYKPGVGSKLGGYDGGVVIHAEDVIAMVRRLEHFEEIMGVEPGADF